MTEVHKSLTVSQSGATAEDVSAESCHIVLDTSPPDYVENVSRYLETSVGHDKVSVGSAEADSSDSGESLFLTQKAVPEAVWSRRRRVYSSRSKPASPRDIEEGEDESEEDSSSSASHGESKIDKEKRRKTYTLPKYHFPFLTDRKCKPRRTLLSVQNSSLHNYVMGGFFQCVRELCQGYGRGDIKPSLPTVDKEEENISPLSEEDTERSEDEDIKVVERKCFLARSKAKGQPTWCNQGTQQRTRRASKAKQETSGGRQTTMLNKRSVQESKLKDKPVSSRNDGHATSERNVLASTETQKTERRLTRESRKNLFPKKAGEEELCNDSDDAVCEQSKLQRKQSTQRGREASTTLTETDVFHMDDVFQTGQEEDGPGSQSLLHSGANDDSVCNETIVRERKDKGDHDSVEEEESQSQKEPESATSVNMEVEETLTFSEDNRAEPPAVQTTDELGINEKKGMENLSPDDNIVRQEEGNTPRKQKKKKRKREKSEAEDVREEVDGNLESNVRVEDSVLADSFNMEECGKEKKKKKKRKTSGEDVEQLQSDDAKIQKKKKKKRKKEEGIVISGDCEEDKAADRTLDLTPEQLEDSGPLENAAASQETLESSHVKKKKHKKKRQPSTVDEVHEGENNADGNFCMDDSVTEADGSGTSLKKKKKKKKKTVFEGVDMSYSHEENEKVENLDNTQKIKEDLDDPNPELVAKKKKKKKKKKVSEIFMTNLGEDMQNDDSVSVREKEKKRTSSFLVADAGERDAETHEEQNPPLQSGGAEKHGVSAGELKEPKDGVRKKKKKRKMSVSQDNMENSCVQDLEEPNKTTDTGPRRKKKGTGNESVSVTPMEKLESAADTGLPPAAGPVVLKKKHEPCHVTQEGLSTATEDVESTTTRSVSHKKKGKHGRNAEISQDSSTSDGVTMDNIVEHTSASSNTPENQELNYKRDKKRRKKIN